MAKNAILNVKIMGRDYGVSYPEGSREELLAAVKLVGDTMQNIQENAPKTTTERIAVLSAILIASDYLNLKDESELKKFNKTLAVSKTKRKIERIQAKLNALLETE